MSAKNKFTVIAGGKSDKKSGRKADELDLVKRISSGDQSAMKQVYELYSKPLTHFVKLIAE